MCINPLKKHPKLGVLLLCASACNNVKRLSFHLQRKFKKHPKLGVFFITLLNKN
jgi:hypothetical protein